MACRRCHERLMDVRRNAVGFAQRFFSDTLLRESGMLMTPRVKLTLFEVVLLAGAVAAGIAYLVSESAFSLTVISVAILAIIALFRDAIR